MNENIIEEVNEEEIVETEVLDETAEETTDENAGVGFAVIAIGVAAVGVAGWCLYKVGELADKYIVKPTAEKVKAKREQRKLAKANAKAQILEEPEVV